VLPDPFLLQTAEKRSTKIRYQAIISIGGRQNNCLVYNDFKVILSCFFMENSGECLAAFQPFFNKVANFSPPL